MGPVDAPATIFSYGDFQRQFVGLQFDYPMSYAVQDFFANGGSQAVIARLRTTEVVEPVDSTGAGDAFCGAFATEHLRSGDAKAAAAAGAAAARVAVSGAGVSALLAAVSNGADR